MWHYKSSFILLCVICCAVSQGQEFECKWDVHNCGQVEFVCNPERIHLDAKEPMPDKEHCLAIHDDDKGELENYEIGVDMLSHESIEGTNSGNLGLIFNYQDELNYDFVYLEIHSSGNSSLTSGYRVHGLQFLDEEVGLNASVSGTTFHSLRLVIDNTSLKSTKVFLDDNLVGSFQEHFVSRLKGGVFILNNHKGVAVFKNFVVEKCNNFDQEGRCKDVSVIWNNAPMTLITEDASDFFTIDNGQVWGDNKIFYANLPAFLKIHFPMYGTSDVNTGEANVLELSSTMVSYLLRSRSWSHTVPLDGWKLISSGPYTSVHKDIDVYKKIFTKGTYIIDNDSAMYLFSDILDNR